MESNYPWAFPRYPYCWDGSIGLFFLTLCYYFLIRILPGLTGIPAVMKKAESVKSYQLPWPISEYLMNCAVINRYSLPFTSSLFECLRKPRVQFRAGYCSDVGDLIFEIMSLRDLVFKAAKLGDVEEMERLIVVMGADPDIKEALKTWVKNSAIGSPESIIPSNSISFQALKRYFSVQVRNRQLSSTRVFRFCHHLSLKIIYFSIKWFSI